ncbi:stage II sporulation protein M [Methanosarcinales archaeon]|nr:MAG: stage II sporulation protein M [Methanosarcinales archaeon]
MWTNDRGMVFNQFIGEIMGFLRSLYGYFILVSLLFILSIMAGYFYASHFAGDAVSFLEEAIEIFEWITTLDPISVMFIIFLNNAVKSFLALIFGLGFGLIPLLFVASNGFIIGILINVSLAARGLLFIGAAILPHGLIEVPMVLLSAAIGLRLGREVISSLKGDKVDISYEFKKSVRFYLRWIMPLLLLAAAIESFITPVIILVVS